MPGAGPVVETSQSQPEVEGTVGTGWPWILEERVCPQESVAAGVLTLQTLIPLTRCPGLDDTPRGSKRAIAPGVATAVANSVVPPFIDSGIYANYAFNNMSRHRTLRSEVLMLDAAMEAGDRCLESNDRDQYRVSGASEGSRRSGAVCQCESSAGVGDLPPTSFIYEDGLLSCHHVSP